jgi:hypothetical protein
MGGRRWLALGLVWLLGCGTREELVYEDDQGFRLTPPPGWVERARPAAVPASPARGRQRGQGYPDVPLPPVGTLGRPGPERFLARYDRVVAGGRAWLRVTAADVPESTPLATCLPPQGGIPNWKREGEAESLEVSGLPAARAAWAGRWDNEDYLTETVAVRKAGKVYFISASFPAADAAAREQVRQSVAGAVWK